jgi:hypothetical protein
VSHSKQWWVRKEERARIVCNANPG